jgi:hypothetical protein
MLLVNEHFDIVHFAGHGIYEPKQDQMGWVFDRDCILSAQEIFQVRQVPRLVFANACVSALTSASCDPRRQHVGLAEAFFSRGIQNYIGTGWPVADEPAREFARRFYSQALGLVHSPQGDHVVGTAPPATLGVSLETARRAILGLGSSWGAYQHYGHANAKLVSFPNRSLRETRILTNTATAESCIQT